MEEFAINAKGLIAQLINFAIILFFLSKFAYKPILAMLENRRKTIEEGLANADKAKSQLENAKDEAKKLEEAAYGEAKNIKATAKDEANAEAAQIITKADAQAKKILAQAEDEAAALKEKALREARDHVASLVTLAVNKVISDELDENQRTKLTAKALEEI